MTFMSVRPSGHMSVTTLVISNNPTYKAPCVRPSVCVFCTFFGGKLPIISFRVRASELALKNGHSAEVSSIVQCKKKLKF